MSATDVAFVQARNELAAHARRKRRAERDHRDGDHDSRVAEAQGGAQQRLVGAPRRAHHGVLLLRHGAAHEHGDGRRHERDRQHERARQCEHDRERHRMEHFSFDAL